MRFGVLFAEERRDIFGGVDGVYIFVSPAAETPHEV
jgi:hypothetical protein